MTSGDTVEIADRGTFLSKVEAIRTAVTSLRTFGDQLARVVDEAEKEASSFTTGGPAPVYHDVLTGLRSWSNAGRAATDALCSIAGSCADTASDKFSKITATDGAAANKIKTL
ncbi:hypothetical protein [Mycolicibacterium aubagnense]|uniref:ESX-1 secretion-associated protein n=1 Tax=Mycolicibacterium aubagnense TaxID=319707 RepID=A0ABM7IM89_9MYCO|nr:hypothetical protein [Mycolicibacterium aubagnense]TLH64281.1 hypothetical protein C1S80_12785 [Mycolicibacterium aubagnense]BBX87928.1 hypothetical protein MAUB_58010 [Mycolicibacterium aubagnense]